MRIDIQPEQASNGQPMFFIDVPDDFRHYVCDWHRAYMRRLLYFFPSSLGCPARVLSHNYAALASLINLINHDFEEC